MSDDGVLPVHADGRSGEVVVLDTSSLSITDIAPSTSPDVAAVGQEPAIPLYVAMNLLRTAVCAASRAVPCGSELNFLKYELSAFKNPPHSFAAARISLAPHLASDALVRSSPVLIIVTMLPTALSIAAPISVPVSDVSSHSAPRDTAFSFALSKASESLTVAVLMAVSRTLASWFVSHLAQPLRSTPHFFALLLSLAAAHCRGNSKTVL